MVSKNGIKIPLDYDTCLPHDCPIPKKGNLDLKTKTNDQNFKNIATDSNNHDPIANQILDNIKKGKEEHNQIGIDLYHLTNEVEEIKQILKNLTSKISSSSFDGSRYR